MRIRERKAGSWVRTNGTTAPTALSSALGCLRSSANVGVRCDGAGIEGSAAFRPHHIWAVADLGPRRQQRRPRSELASRPRGIRDPPPVTQMPGIVNPCCGCRRECFMVELEIEAWGAGTVRFDDDVRRCARDIIECTSSADSRVRNDDISGKKSALAGHLTSRVSEPALGNITFAGLSMRPAGFEPATRGLEVRRSVH